MVGLILLEHLDYLLFTSPLGSQGVNSKNRKRQRGGGSETKTMHWLLLSVVHGNR